MINVMGEKNIQHFSKSLCIERDFLTIKTKNDSTTAINFWEVGDWKSSYESSCNKLKNCTQTHQ